MNILKFPVGPFEVNCYLIVDDQTRQCLLIDPGDAPQKLIEYIESHQLKPIKIMNTHTHIDHVCHLSQIQKHFQIPFFIHEDDLPLLEAMKEQAALFGLNCSSIPEVEGFFKDGDTIPFNEQNIYIMHTPGHSPGSLCFYVPNHVFVGDVLFRESIGRTDLYGGNFQLLLESIKNKLFTLPDETIVHPGHGPDTTIGHEKAHNPFLREQI